MNRTEWRVKNAYEMGLREGLECGQGQIAALRARVEKLENALRHVVAATTDHAQRIALAALKEGEEDCPECCGEGEQINMAPGPGIGMMRMCPACRGTGIKQEVRP